MFQRGVGVASVAVGPKVITEKDVVARFGARFGEEVQVDDVAAARVLEVEIVPAADVVFAKVQVAEAADGHDEVAPLFEGRHEAHDVDDWLGGQPRDGGAADVLDAEQFVTGGGADTGCFRFEPCRPFPFIRFDRDDVRAAALDCATNAANETSLAAGVRAAIVGITVGKRAFEKCVLASEVVVCTEVVAERDFALGTGMVRGTDPQVYLEPTGSGRAPQGVPVGKWAHRFREIADGVKRWNECVAGFERWDDNFDIDDRLGDKAGHGGTAYVFNPDDAIAARFTDFGGNIFEDLRPSGIIGRNDDVPYKRVGVGRRYRHAM